MKSQFKLDDLSATECLAKKIAQTIVPNFIVSLTGNLGAGKTTLVRAIIRALGVSGSVKSPTYTLVEPYVLADYTIFHFDLYRFNDPLEWYEAGFDEYFNQAQISFIEWPDKAAGALPPVDWQLTFNHDDNDSRQLTIYACSEKGITCLNQLILTDVA